MTMSILLLNFMFIACFIAFAIKPSPIYGGLGLIISGGVGCGMILELGGSYLGLVVFLVYLGGMMVVFGYTTAMAAEDYPETWVSTTVMLMLMGGGLLAELLIMAWLVLGDGMEVISLDNVNYWVVFTGDEGGFVAEDAIGVAALYSYGWWLVVVAGWALFVSVFIAIEITRGI
uniref:NADH-ubiquinone oxidoreductase chain 6 n=1 Tax=Eozapus setchuanus TaxID=101673 RepID=A0A0H3UA27_9RODE|nr:NADH dehydrogenase subunit 6 [Eozapus setchuanus]AIG99665.1 NADH dehydrogenase subunit 6 [Eozapus setchuanus]